MATTKTNRATVMLGRAIQVNGVTFRRIGRDDFEVVYPTGAKLSVNPDLAHQRDRATMSGDTDPAPAGESLPATDPR